MGKKKSLFYQFESSMLKAQVKPFANCIWNYQLESLGSNLISVTAENLILTLLPRTNATFIQNKIIALPKFRRGDFCQLIFIFSFFEELLGRNMRRRLPHRCRKHRKQPLAA